MINIDLKIEHILALMEIFEIDQDTNKVLLKTISFFQFKAKTQARSIIAIDKLMITKLAIETEKKFGSMTQQQILQNLDNIRTFEFSKNDIRHIYYAALSYTEMVRNGAIVGNDKLMISANKIIQIFSGHLS